MATPFNDTAFSSGEITPSLFGHVDLARFKTGAATMRNMFCSYRGGAYSRAGTAFVGFSKQTGRAYPPRLIPFQFSLSQGLALEFGHQYMRVIYQGAYVTESAVQITGVTQAVPAVLSTSGASGGNTATPNTGGVFASYAPGDVSTLAGGTYSQPAMVAIATTTLIALQVANPGGGYAPLDTIQLAGGTQTSPASAKVITTQVVSATIANAGSGGTNGTATVTGTTGTGTRFQANVTITAGAISAVNSITVAGAYTTNPVTPSAEPVTGGGLTGATLNLSLGILAFTIATAGTFTANALYGSFNQSSTSGVGVGATFQLGLFAPLAVNFSQAGVYTVFPPNPVAEASTTGGGQGATYTVTTGATTSFNVGDWIYVTGVGGMTQLNGRVFVLGPGFSLNDAYGNPINSTSYNAYSGGGTAARIYTLATPYSEVDLSYLKFTQSADVMSIACVNQQTQTEYPPLDLARITDSIWTLSSIEKTPVQPPVLISASLSTPFVSPGTYFPFNTFYEYVVTAINPKTLSESIASNVGTIGSGFDISSIQGTVSIVWKSVPGSGQYNVYKATPTQSNFPPAGALFGYIGTTFGTAFADTNLIPDLSEVPPTHVNPFARGAIQNVTLTAGGTGYGPVLSSVTVNTSTGTGAFILPVVQNNAISGFIVQEAGEGYSPSDTITVNSGGSTGHGATGMLSVGPTTGTYPSVVAYFQERRFYASTLNQPDTYFASKPGDYTNFDVRLPTIDSDAITGTPWAVNVNGIQFMVPMPGGLVVLTGNRAWQLTGQGGSSLNPQPITPSTQQAQPQSYNGCSATVPPIQIDYDIIYVQAKGSIYRDLSYNFYTNIYTGSDLTLSSSHLFTGYTIREHAYCEEPYKVVWGVRNDGVLLSLTYVKPEQVAGWARHDTNGLFQSVCTITEPPVDALYLAVQRFGAYMIERMDNRIWSGIENVWAVDCGISVPLPQPNATITANSATGLGAVTSATGLVGGTSYSAATTAVVVDNNGKGPGLGAAPSLTIVAGVITAIAFPAGAQGSGYVSPSLVINDPSGQGSGASATLTLSNLTSFATSAPVFTVGSIGSYLRMGGGIAVITAVASTTSATGNIISPIVDVLRDSFGAPQPRPQPAGGWSLATPTQSVGGLQHLAGNYVTGLADGNVVPPTLVSSTGTIMLPAAATAITLGLGFQCQFQSTYVDTGEPTTQGQRKKIGNVTARLEASLGVKVGTNQPDGSTLSPPQLAPAWSGLQTVWDQPNDIPARCRMPYNGIAQPLITADVRVPVFGGFDTRGQVALQQDLPLPFQLLSLVPEILMGDIPEQMARQKQQAQRSR